MDKKTNLGETELEIMELVWQRDEATVADIHELMNTRRKVAYTTVLTIMRNLKNKGYLSFRKEGATHVFKATQPENKVKRNLLQTFMAKTFGNSPLKLLQTLVNDQNMDEAEKRELQRWINEELSDES